MRGPKAHAILWAVALINIGATALFLSFDGSLFGYEWLSYVNGFVGFGILFLSYVLRPIQVRRHYKMNGISKFEYQWSADETEIRSEREGLRSQFNWTSLYLATETKEHFFFWINKIQAVVLPKRALKNESEFDTIRKFLAKAGVKVNA
ncbi:MAG: YcxB family protein [Ahrensia sp.]|nr:YcxB family protein [Ahrensia sp.]